jgi:hypothetical protein
MSVPPNSLLVRIQIRIEIIRIVLVIVISFLRRSCEFRDAGQLPSLEVHERHARRTKERRRWRVLFELVFFFFLPVVGSSRRIDPSPFPGWWAIFVVLLSE